MSRSDLTLLYDGDCGLCQRSVRTVRGLDFLGRVEFLDIASQWPAIHGRFPALTQEACLEEMHLVRSDGTMVKGFDAYRALAWALPLCWPLLLLLYLPGARPLGQRIYARIAGRRHGACEKPPLG